MIRPTNNQLLHRGVAAALALALATGMALVSATPALALGTPRVSLELLDTATVAGSTALSHLVIDESTHRGYVIANGRRIVEVYDVSGPKLVPIASISMGLSMPSALALDEQTHRLVVGDGAAPSISVIDIEPSSPTVNTVIKALDTGVITPHFLAIDGGIVAAGDYAGDTISIITIADNSRKDVTVGFSQKPMVIDPATHIIYVALKGILTIAAIAPDGRVAKTVVPTKPLSITMSGGSLLIGTQTRIERYNPATMALSGVSPTLPVDAERIQADDTTGVIYPSSSSSGAITPVLNSESLAIDGTVDFGINISEVAVDEKARHTVVIGTGATIKMYASNPPVTRLTGADRFVVSAAISAEQFVPGSTTTAYVASGAVFADALAASAAAGAKGAPVLLVQKDAIPREIADELTRLHPDRIVVIGGTSTIDATVEAALGGFAPKVERISGTDRYEGAAAISRATFGTGVPVAYIASGATFPDALSGSAAAGKKGGPVLLVENSRIPDAVKTELQRLAPMKVVVLGGANSIAPSVVDELTRLFPTTTRTDGADRFIVSAKISAAAFDPGLKTVYVASGATFPDALSGAAAAVAKSAPVLLVAADGIPAAVATELDRLNPSRIIVLGGTTTLPDTVLEALRKYIV